MNNYKDGFLTCGLLTHFAKFLTIQLKSWGKNMELKNIKDKKYRIKYIKDCRILNNINNKEINNIGIYK